MHDVLPALLIAADFVLLVLAGVLIVRIWCYFNRNLEDHGAFWMALEDAVAHQFGPIAAVLIVGEPKPRFVGR